MITLCGAGTPPTSPSLRRIPLARGVPGLCRRRGTATGPGNWPGAWFPHPRDRVDFARHDNRTIRKTTGDAALKSLQVTVPPSGSAWRRTRPSSRSPSRVRLPGFRAGRARWPSSGSGSTTPLARPCSTKVIPRELGPGARIGIPEAAGRSVGSQRQVRGRRGHRVRAARRGSTRCARRGWGFALSAKCRRSPTPESRSGRGSSASRKATWLPVEGQRPPPARWCRWM